MLSLTDHDVIGFDVDHTFAKYDILHLYNTIHDSLVKFLIETRDWDESLKEPFSKYNSFCTRGIVLDIRKGNFLKVRSDGFISRAAHGTHFLSDDDITATYGADRVWSLVDRVIQKVDNIASPSTGTREFMLLDNFYDCVGMVAIGRMIDIIDERLKKQGHALLENYTYIWKDAMDGYGWIYQHTAFQNDTGGFFPPIKRETDKFIFPCAAATKQWLRDLKKNGTVLFLMTSSYVDFAKTTLDFIFGDDWQELFDLTITFARKPSFFVENHKFLKTDLQGSVQTEVAELESGQIYAQGNLKDLMQYFQKTTGKESPKVLYCGDSLRSDIFPAKQYAGWNTLMLLEEMHGDTIKNTGCSSKSANVSASDCECLSAEMWGSFFTEGGTTVRKYREVDTLWAHCVSKYADIAIPTFDYITGLPIDHKFPVFKQNDSISGFYPEIPQALLKS